MEHEERSKKRAEKIEQRQKMKKDKGKKEEF